MTTASAIEVAFPVVDQGSTAMVVPAARALPASTGLATVVRDPAQRRTLSCLALLQGEARQRVENEAPGLLDDMLANTQVLFTYGTAALKGVNDLVNRLLHEVEPTRIPELKQLARQLNDGMREIKSDYDISDPKVREKYEQWKGGLMRFFGRGKTLLEMLMEDVRSIEGQLDKIAGTLGDRQYQLLRNVGYYDELYEQNELEILELIYHIAVMERVRDLAAERAAAIEVGDASLGDRQGEQKAILAEFVSNMEIKIAEYKGRLFVAWSTSPQVRMMRTLNVGLAERINELICVTIPTMKATVLYWRMLIQTKEAAELSELVAQASNEWLVAYAEAGAVLVPQIAATIQQPTLAPQTVAAMADSISRQADGIVKAIEEGDARRAELDSAIIEAQGVMNAATGRVTDAAVNGVIERALRTQDLVTTVHAS